MKKNLFLRLCLILFAIFYLQSCRNDYYDQANHQASAGKSAFRLVKLSQIPHITSFIKKESGRKDLSLSFTETSLSGNLAKAADMSDVKIETQTIISVERNNATYYVFRISGTDSQENTTFYNLEVKETGGSAVNAQIIEYNSDVAFSENPLLQMQNFTGTVTTYSLDGELSSRYSLDDGTGECPPEGYYPPQDGGSSDPPIDPTTGSPGIPGEWDPGFGFPGTGGGGGGDTPSNPDDCWEIVTVPTQPWRTLGWQNACTGEWIDNPADNGGNMENNGTGILNSGCGDGSGTVIVPGEVEDPCEKTKTLLEDPVLTAKVGTLKEKSKIEEGEPGYGESAVEINNDGTTSGIIPGGDHEVKLESSAGKQGAYHNHTPEGIKMFSPADILSMLTYSLTQPIGNLSNGFLGMVGTEKCGTCPNGYKYHNYIIRFSGNSQELEKYLFQTIWDEIALDKIYKRRKKELSKDTNYADYEYGPLNSDGLEKLFFDTLQNMGMEGKVNLQRIENNGTIQNITQNNNGTTSATECP